MKIIITQPEIEQILQAHALKSFTMNDGSIPTISFTATRGADGITAEIDIPYIGVSSLDLGASAIKESKPVVIDKPKVSKTEKKNVFADLAKKAEPAAPEPESAEATESEAEPDPSTDDAGEASGESAEETASAEADKTPKKGSLFGDN